METNDIIDQYKNGGASLRDAIKTLRTNISFSSMDKEIKTIVITSVTPHEGKSTLAVFLGLAMAESLQRTLLVECDLRRPMLQNYLKLRPPYSLLDVMGKRATDDIAIIPTKAKYLDLLSAAVLANPVEILGSVRFQTLIDELKPKYDVIILDTPPLGSFIEPAILASKSDGTIIVLKTGATDVAAAQAVVSQLEKAKARILGVVINGVEASGGDYYYYSYYDDDGEKKRKKRKRLGKRRRLRPGRQKRTEKNVPAASKLV